MTFEFDISTDRCSENCNNKHFWTVIQFFITNIRKHINEKHYSIGKIKNSFQIRHKLQKFSINIMFMLRAY